MYTLEHGTIIRTGITCKKKVYRIRYGFEVERDALNKQKAEIFLVTRPPTC